MTTAPSDNVGRETFNDGGGSGPARRGVPWRVEGIPRRDQGGQPGDRKKRFTPWLWLAVLYLGFFLIFSFQDRASVPVTVPYSEFKSQVQSNNVAEVFSRGDTIEGKLRQERPLPATEGQPYTDFVTERPTFADDNLLSALEANNVTVRATPLVQERGVLLNLLISIAPIALLVLFYLWLFKRQAGMFGSGGFGSLGGKKFRPVDPGNIRVTFKDVAGIDEVEAEISEVVDFLKGPGKYQAIGARPPKGVLLSGPPGTGKTLLARATAGEAGVPFFHVSSSEFVEMVVGVGASRVRELFQAAREAAPSIIFIDEIDAIGRKRGGSLTVGGHDEREQTLNQILTEMDGFSSSEGVVVLAATNRPDVLDPALLRPGRFDRSITVHAPDQTGRLQILKVQARNVKLDAGVDLDLIARVTPGMTGAELANLVNEAALLAVKRAHPAVTQRDLFDALEKVQLGTVRNVVMPPDERRRTAYHESGHALLGMLEPGADPVRKISIIPRGRALGVTLSTPDTDRYGYDENYLRGRIVGALGGMAAERLVFGVVTSGAESDLQTSTNLARTMVGRWGMSPRIGPVQILPEEGDPRALGISEGMLDILAEETRALVDQCYDRALTLLRENRWRLESLVEQLLANETLDEPEIYAAAGLQRPTSSTNLPQEENQTSPTL
ncbi:ATP-dependent zinc metalloprotease FtsH [Pseudarthrobacter phenanthrenivorans]|uniref:ATP-dependent zinc metalloprotease FtsH n=1 Tax=Pseudarthrobacter phenanthrenivorans TaxID=361575 RepID=UPI0011271456|nr:ATP-dependent zinc metalloprotease FtsH [Pseudarthrobacter phenanthrenivorans]TPV47583.1 ATP-dependent zinc metalloprotease FtsH [Pseudarthrobacter phenanthrenivorans]